MAILLLARAARPKQDEIEHYVVTKPDVLQREVFPDSASVTGSSAAQQDRLLAAIVPHASRLWFFKVVGADGAVVEDQKAFADLLTSLRFPSADAKPEWTLPSGWSEKPGDGQMRAATILLPAEKKPLEMSVTSLPGPTTDDKPAMKQALLANVNRWRGQFRLRPIGLERLNDELQEIKAGEGLAYVIAITGRYQPGGMMGPMAGDGVGSRESGVGSEGTGGSPTGHPPVDMPAGHPPVALPDGHPPIDAEANDSASSPSPPGLKYDKPADWQSAPPTPFSVLSFAVVDGDHRVQITASRLGGQLTPESLASNVNRWRGQLGLAPQDQQQAAAEGKSIAVAGGDGRLVELSSEQTAIVGAIVGRPDGLWFFKLQGDKSLAEKQKSSFETFLKSIRFADDGGK